MFGTKRNAWRLLLLGLALLLSACGGDKGGNETALWDHSQWNQANWQ